MAVETEPTFERMPTADSRWPDGHPRRRVILLVMCLSLLVVVIDNTILNTALPTMARTLPAGTSALQWITDAYSLCLAALLIPFGALGDRFGRRRFLLGGLVLFGLASLAAAMATNADMLIFDRVLMGAGAACVMPATLSILNAVFSVPERPQAIAAWSAVAGIGIVIGPTLGGALLDHFYWGSVFLVNLPLVALAIVGVVLVVPETAEPAGRGLDVVGTIVIALSLVALVDAVIEAPSRGWTAPRTLLELGIAAVGLAVFAVWELRMEDPLIDLRVFRYRAFTASSGAITLIFFALFGSLFVLTQYLQLVHGYSPFGAGVRAVPFAIAMGVLSPISADLVRHLGERTVISSGVALMGLGLLDLSRIGVSTGYGPMAVAIVIMGAGMGLVMAPASTTIMASVPASQAGAGSAINDTIREVGGSLGVAVVGSLTASLYARHLAATLHAHHAPAGLTHAATSSVAAADAIGAQAGGGTGAALTAAAHSAFTEAMSSGMQVAGAVALLGALACFLALPRRRRALADTPSLVATSSGCAEQAA